MLLKSSEPQAQLPADRRTCYNYAYEGLILCVYCSTWNTKFADCCRRCCTILDELCIVCSYDGVPLFTLGGESLLEDRLLPAGWKCCGCRALNMDDDGRSERWKCSRLGSWAYKHETDDAATGRPCHPPTFCPTCKVVNRYRRSLAYMGADYLVGKPTEQGPLDLHFRFLDRSRPRQDRDLRSAEAKAVDSLRSIDGWIQLIRKERKRQERTAPEDPETPAVVLSIPDSPAPLSLISPTSDDMLVTAFPGHEFKYAAPSIDQISESDLNDTSIHTIKQHQQLRTVEEHARRRRDHARSGYASSEQDHDMADEPVSVVSTLYAGLCSLKNRAEELEKTRDTPVEDSEVILDCIVVGGSGYGLDDSDQDEYLFG